MSICGYLVASGVKGKQFFRGMTLVRLTILQEMALTPEVYIWAAQNGLNEWFSFLMKKIKNFKN